MKKLGLIALICGLVFTVSATAKAVILYPNVETLHFYADYGGTQAAVSWLWDGDITMWLHIASMNGDPIFAVGDTVSFDMRNVNQLDSITLSFPVVDLVEFMDEFDLTPFLVGPSTEPQEYVVGPMYLGSLFTGMSGPEIGGPGGPAYPSDPLNTDPEGSPIPEPGTLLLLGSGLIGFAGYVKLRSSRKKTK